MIVWVQTIIFVLLSAAVVRALYIVASFGSGGENFYEKPGLIIKYRKLPDTATVLLPLAAVAIGYVGYKLFGWIGLFAVPAATLIIGCPLIAILLRKRNSRASIYYYSNPFIQLLAFLPLFVIFAFLLPINIAGAA